LTVLIITVPLSLLAQTDTIARGDGCVWERRHTHQGQDDRVSSPLTQTALMVITLREYIPASISPFKSFSTFTCWTSKYKSRRISTVTLLCWFLHS